MRSTLLAVAMTAVAGLGAMVPNAVAAPGDNTTFSMVRAAGATCLSNKARGRVTISDLGAVQNMHVEVSGLTPNNDFTLFITQHSTRPFGLELVPGGNLNRQER